MIMANTKIKVIGIGGAGGNILNSIIDNFKNSSIDFAFIDSDKSDLDKSKIKEKLMLSEDGLGACSDNVLVEVYIQNSETKIAEMIKGVEILILIAGITGGTGAGASVGISKIAKKLGIFTIMIAIMPFDFEGDICQQKISFAFEKLEENTNAIIKLSNDKLLSDCENRSIFLNEAYNFVFPVIQDCIKTLLPENNQNGFTINFEELKKYFSKKNDVFLGIGTSKKEVTEATLVALRSKFSTNGFDEASTYIVNVFAKNLLTNYVSKIKETIKKYVGSNPTTIIKFTIDNTIPKNELKIVIIGI